MKRQPKLLRPFATLALAAAIGFGTSACSSVERDAARVGTHVITVDELETTARTQLLVELRATKQVKDVLSLTEDEQRVVAKYFESAGLWVQQLQASTRPEDEEARNGWLAANEAVNQAATAGDVAGIRQGLDEMEKVIAAHTGTADTLSAAAVRSNLTTMIAQQIEQDANAEVWVNPAYGTWDPAQSIIVPLSDVAPPNAGE